ncbi:2-succinyl-5-enolpyruvyl-6-hydroxy-3-cyclohexene-1-carboxylic-acid synthase [Aquihabitans daechungensis]|uniref:2-succinyl-5-enolpyruvyl-6-hydroxy-3- cyclohexene-1-carboxylic-acid synthase n=1 Tax=Aquihabitans daechungensis TaxID=1052257 RepID=UPI003B9F24CA
MSDDTRPQDIQAAFCATLVDEWVRGGVTDAVICPGSRSTPMALALSAEDRIAVHVHHDERAGAFTALGLGLASGRPALVLTTSGTGAVELHPAVVEAHQAGIPLLALTADRPPELHDVGAPQTVQQVHLFGRSVRWFADPGVPDAAASGSWRSLASRALAEATTGPAGPGPVHLNLAFREPLVGAAGDLPPGRADGAPWHTTIGRRSAVDRFGTARLEELLDADRGVIVAGAGAGDPAVVHALSAATGWPVLADPRSGCRTPSPGVVAAFDPILRHGPTAAVLVPDVVLRLGMPPASKVLGQWVASSGAVEVAIDAHGRWFDAEHRAAHVLHADPAAAAQALVHLVGGRATVDTGWLQAWIDAEQVAQAAIDATIDRHLEPTEPGIARTVVGSLPEGSTLVVSSSMPVRDVEWFAAPRSGLRVLANRGANGIDGVISTGVGVALAARGTGAATVVLVGDVALLHDSNAFLGLADRGVDLTVVVVDNDGGGIFSFLPQGQALGADRFEQLFGTPHGVDLSVLAAAHGLMTVEPATGADVADAVHASVGAGGARLVQIRTDRTANVDVHDEINAAVAAALAGS